MTQLRTQNPAPYGAGIDKAHPDLCDIFNWDKLKRGVRCPNSKPCKWKQEYVNAGKSRGGNNCHKDESKRTDVDAITFADRDWYFYS
ncbi:hypothetical protein CLAFUW4_07696 [Fulvia fulva]|uniref:Uncharacterized protein n=1 Tax=Passalora fulva TaxID=5499 RepID=A0A9Q8P6I2_PASFU|nr:uncharacterized protein CLAFUR5_07824 [Fulvia fulva]KAK4628927.1 hypothetical protein CLAFUR4_07701 [Fulvia fulva]KAK4630777.1 hypothetical protein CLAFUR0_07699 [Fulvia fulva]UJO15029.1 hypothetical protein CLAFUR5_07824 [Fulvia fulva]WPV12374.1 hypothetical protein CLAFUW4_07696 [Fulvia fulva]WPV27101.1 hypothetical protein CLAFUW7_07697 [Fulvia fulva]